MTVAEARAIVTAHRKWRIGEVDMQTYSARQINTALQVLVDATGPRPAPSPTRMPL